MRWTENDIFEPSTRRYTSPSKILLCELFVEPRLKIALALFYYLNGGVMYKGITKLAKLIKLMAEDVSSEKAWWKQERVGAAMLSFSEGTC